MQTVVHVSDGVIDIAKDDVFHGILTEVVILVMTTL